MVIVLGLVFFFLALPMAILVTIESGKALREMPGVPRPLRILAIGLLIPQALLGFLSAAVGLSIVFWVAYRVFVERMPGFGWMPAIGTGFGLAAAGYFWSTSAFKRLPRRKPPS